MMPIAIVGRGCALPGAPNPVALGALSRAGGDTVSATPPARWGIADDLVLRRPDESGPDTTWSNRGGYVTDVIEPRGYDEAAHRAALGGNVGALDAVHRWLLHAGGDALREAGLGQGGPRVGAVIGNLSFPTAGMARYAEGAWLQAATPGWCPQPRGHAHERFMSGLPVHAFARAFHLDGGAFALDAACASSLVAVEIACARLARGEVDAMVAGAVNAADDLFLHLGFRALEALSKSGRSRPFHRHADGLLPAEGAALVVLERLEDAVRTGRRILGVIRGVGLSNDGRGEGLLVPSRDGQRRAIAHAYAEAQLDPRRVSWLECHATGTVVGDGTELASSAAVLGDRSERLPIGSLKANFGHAITAAGAAGLLRVLDALEHETLPPTPHVDAPLEALANGPFELLAEARPWAAGDGPRVAGVSAFGFGGNNAHLVLEEYRGATPKPMATSKSSADPVVVVAMGVRVGDAVGAAAFAAEAARASSVELGLPALRMPPRDVEETLPQQLLLVEVVDHALAQLATPLDPERTSVLVGMGCDTEVARHGGRWRLAEWGRRVGAGERWVAEARDGFAPLLGAAGVLGCMPNICANRLNRQHGFAGPSATLSAEELSGLRALEVARRYLERGTADAAVVAAVDVSDEPAHRQAAQILGIEGPTADGAIALVVMRRRDAEERGDTILVELGDSEGPAWTDGAAGHAHAASGLLQVGAAIHACIQDAPPDGRRLRVEVPALGGEHAAVTVSAERARRVPPPRPLDGPTVCRPVHAPPPSLPPLPTEQPEQLPAAPPLGPPDAAQPASSPLRPHPTPQRPDPSVGPRTEATASSIDSSPSSATLVEVARSHGDRLLAHHEAYLAEQHAAFETFRQHQRQLWAATLQALSPANGTAFDEASPPMPDPQPSAYDSASPSDSVSVSKSNSNSRPPTEPPPTGRRFSRAELEVHASGQISSIFGSAFAPQDPHALQVRMPERRLLLADRVTGLAAEPAVLGQGTVWTETDVRADSWFLHAGRMPAGLMIEAGQADLFLISYMGIDLLNRGERAYRLLGCDVTYRRSLPAIGETMRYDIHVDGHAEQGDIRLFFFHYDCRIGDDVVLSVRNGQAGFFSDAELADSDGVLWDPSAQEIVADARLDPPLVPVARRTYEAAHIEAFAEGDLVDCFGPGFERTRCHVRTPTIQGGDMRLSDRIELERRGGPWGRGYLRATLQIRPDQWFFDGHFKNDPCMPGTLMLEGCLQLMAFYLAAHGYTVDRDGWRFEPVPDHSVNLRCRGQVLPHDEELVCELFVEEVHDGPYPTIYADLLGTVKGLKAFHARRMGLRLVPDWPLGSHPSLPGGPGHEGAPDPDVAEVDGFPFDYASLLACAWGKPSRAFGPMYAPFDDTRRVARLPGPPYHFMSRVAEVEGAIGGMEVGSRCAIAYDVPPDAWYFRDNGHAVMPFSVLLEVVLQPCGWLASYVGSALTTDVDLSFRNLDGDGIVHREVGPDVGTLTTTTTLTQISQTAGMIIQSFTLECHAPEGLVFSLDTVFGFFPKEALENQVGLPTTDAQRAALAPRRSEMITDPALARPGLLMIDRLVAFEADGGGHGLGRAVAEKDVDPGEWFFRAHFFQDPVQPGSLGLEAVLQLLQLFMRRAGLAEGPGRFEPLAVAEPIRWKYRGQVVPENRVITTDVTITDRGQDDAGGATVRAEASLWVDGKRIYEAAPFGMRWRPT